MLRDPEFQDNFEVPLCEIKEDFKKRRNIWQVLSRVMEVVIYVLLILAVGRLFVPEFDRQRELQAEIDRLAIIQSEKESQVTRLRQEHRLLKTDKEYLETVARDRLNMQKEGEYIIKIERGEE